MGEWSSETDVLYRPSLRWTLSVLNFLIGYAPARESVLAPGEGGLFSSLVQYARSHIAPHPTVVIPLLIRMVRIAREASSGDACLATAAAAARMGFAKHKPVKLPLESLKGLCIGAISKASSRPDDKTTPSIGILTLVDLAVEVQITNIVESVAVTISDTQALIKPAPTALATGHGTVVGVKSGDKTADFTDMATATATSASASASAILVLDESPSVLAAADIGCSADEVSVRTAASSEALSCATEVTFASTRDRVGGGGEVSDNDVNDFQKPQLQRKKEGSEEGIEGGGKKEGSEGMAVVEDVRTSSRGRWWDRSASAIHKAASADKTVSDIDNSSINRLNRVISFLATLLRHGERASSSSSVNSSGGATTKLYSSILGLSPEEARKSSWYKSIVHRAWNEYASACVFLESGHPYTTTVADKTPSGNSCRDETAETVASSPDSNVMRRLIHVPGADKLEVTIDRRSSIGPGCVLRITVITDPAKGTRSGVSSDSWVFTSLDGEDKWSQGISTCACALEVHFSFPSSATSSSATGISQGWRENSISTAVVDSIGNSYNNNKNSSSSINGGGFHDCSGSSSVRDVNDGYCQSSEWGWAMSVYASGRIYESASQIVELIDSSTLDSIDTNDTQNAICVAGVANVSGKKQELVDPSVLGESAGAGAGAGERAAGTGVPFIPSEATTSTTTTTTATTTTATTALEQKLEYGLVAGATSLDSAGTGMATIATNTNEGRPCLHVRLQSKPQSYALKSQSHLSSLSSTKGGEIDRVQVGVRVGVKKPVEELALVEAEGKRIAGDFVRVPHAKSIIMKLERPNCNKLDTNIYVVTTNHLSSDGTVKVDRVRIDRDRISATIGVSGDCLYYAVHAMSVHEFERLTRCECNGTTATDAAIAAVSVSVSVSGAAVSAELATAGAGAGAGGVGERGAAGVEDRGAVSDRGEDEKMDTSSALSALSTPGIACETSELVPVCPVNFVDAPDPSATHSPLPGTDTGTDIHRVNREEVEEVEVELEERESESESDDEGTGMWSCSRCTMLNPVSVSVCDMCEMGRYGEEGSSFGGDLSLSGSADRAVWGCVVCTCLNSGKLCLLHP